MPERKREQEEEGYGRWIRRVPWELLLLCSLAVGVLFWRLGEKPLLDWDEALYAQVAREMVEQGQWFDLSWGYEPYFKKPPLLFWAIALSYQLFDINEWATRLPSVLFGIGSVILVSLLGRQLFGRLAGFCSGFLLLTLYPFLTHGSRQSATDSPLLFFSLLALSCFWAGRRFPPALFAVGLAFGAGILAKGIVAFLPVLVMLFFCVWTREYQHFRSHWLRYGFAGGGLLALPWYGYQTVMYGLPFLRTFLWDETLTRLVTTYDASFRPWLFYVETLWADMFHCLPLLVGFTALCLLSRSGEWTSLSLPFRFILCWLAAVLLATMSTQTRHAWYLLPVYPPLCVLLAGMGVKLWYDPLAGTVGSRSLPAFLRRTAVGALVGWFCVLLPGHVRWTTEALLWIEEMYQDRNVLLQEVAELLDPNIPLYTVGLPMPGVVFYSRRPAAFLSEDDFSRLDTTLTAVYALVLSDTLAARLGEQGFSLLGQRGGWTLFSYEPVVSAEVEMETLLAGEELTDEL